MDSVDLKKDIETAMLMLEVIKEQVDYNTEEITLKALLNVNNFISNSVMKNKGEELLKKT